MNSRERIQAILNHQLPDVLPIDFGGHRSSGMGAQGYNNLKRYLGYPTETTKLFDIMQQLALPEEYLVDRFGGDIMQIMRLEPAFGVKVDKWKCGYLPCGDLSMVPYGFNPVANAKGDNEIYGSDGTLLARQAQQGIYYDNMNYFLEGVTSIDELKSRFQDPFITDEELDFIEVQAKELYYNTDKAILLPVGCSIFEGAQQEFGFEDFYCNLISEPELMHYWAARKTEGYLEVLDKIINRAGKYIDFIWFGGDDLGTQEAPQISTDTYREMIKPYHKKLYHFVQEKDPTCKVGLHSCGSIRPLIPDLIDAGVQVLNPIQVSAKNMDPETLKKEFGTDLIFMGGGADMQGFVNATDDPGAIYEHVTKLIEIFAPNGNYIFSQIHNILDNVSPEKVVTIYQAALDYRKNHPYILK